MKILYSWLKDFIDLDDTPEELAQKLTSLGIEVASIEKKGADFEGVNVAQITHIEDHPNSDHLHLVDLDLGGGKTQRVVCGAPNVAVGQKVPLARVGARLGKTVLGPAKIRGVVSEGMICSSDELGLTSTRARGILVLDENIPLGTDVRTLYGKSDALFDLEITSNRPDLMSHLGVARELSALLNKPVKWPAPKEYAGEGESLKVDIRAPQGCQRYTGRIIRGVKNAPSPELIQERLSAMGLNPKNALVDVTNYVMFEVGQPLHAFDRNEIDGDTIVVRWAEKGEKFTLLDGRELTLDENALMIGDDKKATALAGVMGGLNSGIKDDTTDIFIESAYFDAPTTNKTSKTYAVSSDSSQRFERGTDIGMTELALKRATELFVAACGGTPSKIRDVYPQPYENPVVRFTPAQINGILGADIPEDKLKDIFSRLALKFDASGSEWTFQAPTHRRDLNHRWDLAEEAARFAGFDCIPVGESRAFVQFNDNPKGVDLLELFSEKLAGLGFYECKNIDFLGEKELKDFGFDPKNAVKIKNAMAKGWDYMRPTLLPALLKNIAFNQSRGNRDLALFEATRTFTLIKGFPAETYTVSGVLCGRLTHRPFFKANGEKPDFYFLKGVMQSLLEGFEGVSFAPSASAPVYMHPKICMDVLVNGKKAGVFGAVHPLALKSCDVKENEVWAFELALKPLEKGFSAQQFKPAAAVTAFPPSLRDLSVMLDKTVPYAAVADVLKNTPLPVGLHFDLIDLYEGDRLPQGKKSVTFTLAFSAPDRTLKDAETDAAFNALLENLKAKTGAELR
ncbi:MAG TPA: phenylalanine--tRNA ligase subunit beta [Candidatus Avelusimicrobium excrementipullorum]|nr:phenylalanine--tRNA ligase subunit beta [Candidatus Avelusimicrobium excrementipullorum]